jgi:hypothetical protein
MRIFITQQTILNDRLRRLKILILQYRIEICMGAIASDACSEPDKRLALGKLVGLVAARNELYTDSELHQKAVERGLA